MTLGGEVCAILKTEELTNMILSDEFINIYEKMYKNSSYSRKAEITYKIVLFNIGKYEESLEVFNKTIFICRKNGMEYSIIYSLLWKVILLNKLKSNDTRQCINI